MRPTHWEGSDGQSKVTQIATLLILMTYISKCPAAWKVEIQEVDHAIALQFQINMRWTENRVKYQNLKSKTTLNALTKNDIRKLWLPRIVYDNTDQKQTTRLGMEWEWATGVSVVKEGNFTRSGYGEVNEAEIFEGDENTLMMTQTYTWEFQCEYKLQKYPFDTQV